MYALNNVNVYQELNALKYLEKKMQLPVGQEYKEGELVGWVLLFCSVVGWVSVGWVGEDEVATRIKGMEELSPIYRVNAYPK